MSIKNSVLDYMKYKQINWYGQMRRMKEESLPLPSGKRRKKIVGCL